MHPLSSLCLCGGCFSQINPPPRHREHKGPHRGVEDIPIGSERVAEILVSFEGAISALPVPGFLPMNQDSTPGYYLLVLRADRTSRRKNID